MQSTRQKIDPTELNPVRDETKVILEETLTKTKRKDILDAATKLLAVMNEDVRLLTTIIIPIAEKSNAVVETQNSIFAQATLIEDSITNFQKKLLALIETKYDASLEDAKSIKADINAIDEQVKEFEKLKQTYERDKSSYKFMPVNGVRDALIELDYDLTRAHLSVEAIKTTNWGLKDKVAIELKKKMENLYQILLVELPEHRNHYYAISHCGTKDPTIGENGTIFKTYKEVTTVVDDFNNLDFVKSIKSQIKSERTQTTASANDRNRLYGQAGVRNQAPVDNKDNKTARPKTRA